MLNWGEGKVWFYDREPLRYLWKYLQILSSTKLDYIKTKCVYNNIFNIKEYWKDLSEAEGQGRRMSEAKLELLLVSCANDYALKIFITNQSVILLNKT